MKVALLGDVALELLAQDFCRRGYEAYVPPGFDTWRQELLDPASGYARFGADATVFVSESAPPPEIAGRGFFVPDLAALAAETPDFFDARLRQLASMPFSLAGLAAIVDEFEFWRLRRPCKVLAVDADNTLWDGILSEDGADELAPFADWQKGLLDLRRAGVALVLLSKNDEGSLAGDAPVWKGPLAADDFTARRVNWAPKAGNLLAACRELNLDPESVVFVDDNPHERAQMAAHLPAVTVAPFPADLAEPRQFLRRLGTYFFADAGRTREDALRADDYAANRARAAFRATCAPETVDAYLDGLGLTAAASDATAADLDRLAQMAGKTNQFNATTIRRTRGDFAALLADPTKRVFVFRAADRFGEQGLVCYAVADLVARRVTDFVMSCRAMGRTLEHFAWAHICAALGYAPEVDFRETAKNGPFRAFWQKLPEPGSTHYRAAGSATTP